VRCHDGRSSQRWCIVGEISTRLQPPLSMKGGRLAIPIGRALPPHASSSTAGATHACPHGRSSTASNSRAPTFRSYPPTEPDPEEPEDIQGLFDGRLSGKVGETRNPYGQQPEPAGAPYRRADEQADPAPAELAAPNVEAVRAAFSAHARLQNAVADAVARAGLRALSPIGAPAFDIAWRRFDGRVVICEVKSAEPDRLEDQMRAAVAQALRYQALAEHKLGEQVDACIFIEREPDAIWLALCQRLGLAVAWAPDADRLI
jgi:hypothetical protein